jgi:hypothetical protein
MIVISVILLREAKLLYKCGAGNRENESGEQELTSKF